MSEGGRSALRSQRQYRVLSTRYLVLGAALSALGYSGCSSRPQKLAPDPQAQVVKVFGGEANLEFMKTAPTVSACRLHVAKGGYAADEAVAVSPDQIREFRNILQNPKTYLFELAKACEPDYGVRLQFVTDQKRIDVDFCFSCNILRVLDDGEEDFDNGRPQLVALCKQLLPGEVEIQQLDPNNPRAVDHSTNR